MIEIITPAGTDLFDLMRWLVDRGLTEGYQKREHGRLIWVADLAAIEWENALAA